jgi:hypothetical protein
VSVLAPSPIAADLAPGDTFTLPSGDTFTAVQVNHLSHKVYVLTNLQTWVSLFPRVRVQVQR